MRVEDYMSRDQLTIRALRYEVARWQAMAAVCIISTLCMAVALIAIVTTGAK